MSRHASPGMVVALLGALCAAAAGPVAAQERPAAAQGSPVRDALAARIDSLAARHRELETLVRRRDSVHEAAAALLRTDTVAIGPFRFVNRTAPAADLITALETAWLSYAPMIGAAAAELDGVVISQDVSRTELAAADPQVRHYSLRVTGAGGRPDVAGAADRVIASALVDAAPADVRAWLRNAHLTQTHPFRWAYRDLALSRAPAARGCFARDAKACVEALTGDTSETLNPATLASLLRSALEQGGAGSYARLLEDAPDVSARLAHAAKRPIDEVVASWRDAVQDGRPRIHAGVARAGFWTLVWLMGLAFFAMRSTRCRLG